MTPEPRPEPEICTCLALRQAARHVSQSYDQVLAPSGLRTTQFSILAKLKQHGALTINALAAALVMDRTTLGRNILPLERDGLIAVAPSGADRRSKQLRLTDAGSARLRAAFKLWGDAQRRFESAFGVKRTAVLHALMRDVTTAEFAPGTAAV